MPYIGNTIRAADDYRLIDDISSGFNGSATSFALQVAGSAPVPFPKSPQQVLISVNGVIQEPDPTGASGFNLVGTNIVFSSAPTNGHAFFGIIYATADYLNAGGNFPAGSLGAPSITFIGDENTGLFRKSGGSVGFVSDATEIANFDSNGITISSGNIIIPDSIIHNGDTNTKIRFPAADTVTVETGGTERLKVDSNGRLAISLSTARASGGVSGMLQVERADGNGAINIVQNQNNAAGSPSLVLAKSRGTSVGSNTVVANNDTLGSLKFAGADGTDLNTPAAQIAGQVDGTPGSNDMPGRLVFSTTADGASSLTERMRIDASGRVGIGTASPVRNLHIKDTSPRIMLSNDNTGHASGDGTELMLDTSGNFEILQRENLNLEFFTNNLQRMTILGDGKVGIGTSSPSSQNNATNLVVGNTSSNNGICILTGTNNDGVLSFNNANDTDLTGYIIYEHSTDSLRFGTTTSERLRIDSSGNVGIGTTSTGSYPVGVTPRKVQMEIKGAIDVGAATHQGQLALNCTNSSSALHLVRSDNTQTSGTGIGQVMFTYSDGTDFHAAASILAIKGATGGNNDTPGALTFATTADGATSVTERMRIDSSGNVGIGTTSPNEKLVVNGNSSVTGALFITSNTSTPSAGAFLYRPASNTLAFGSNSAERMRIDSSGKVMIGITSSGVPFQINATASAFGGQNTVGVFGDTTSFATGVGGGITLSGRYNSSSSQVGFGAIRGIKENGTDGNYDGALTFSTRPNQGSLTERMRIHSNGNVTMPNQACMVFTNPVDVNTPSENTPLQFSGLDVSKGGMAESNSRSRITVPTTGTYLISALISGSITTANSTDGIELHLRKNGSIFPSSASFPITSYGSTVGDEYYIDYTIILNLTASDYLEVALTNIDSSVADVQRGYFAVSLIH